MILIICIVLSLIILLTIYFDWKRKPKKIKYIDAVCVIIHNEGKVLGVARRDTVDKWGLPGGKVEEGEDPKLAAVRELFEETDIKVSPDNLHFVYCALCNGYMAATYLHLDFENRTKIEPRQGDAGPVRWVTWNDLISGPFGSYNYQALDKLCEKIVKFKYDL